MRFARLMSACIPLSIVFLAACASSQHATGSTRVIPTSKGSEAQVELEDFKIHMPTTIPAGDVLFKVVNKGSHKHNIHIKGNGVDAALENDLKPGESADLKACLKAGEYEVTCPVGPHAMLGMRLRLTVEAAAR